MKRTTCLTTTALMGFSLLGATTFGLTSGAASAATSAAGATCRGETPTIVGPGKRLKLLGTEGRDVVLTNGAVEVNTLGGDDLVCVTDKAAGLRYVVTINSGPGDDVVDGSPSPRTRVSVDLETGVDHFIGGDANDYMRAVPPGRDPATGPDTFDGGGGEDAIDLSTGAVDAVIDNQLGRFSEGPQVLANWTGIEEFYLGSVREGSGDLDFIGSTADETIVDELLDYRVSRFDLGAGDDRFYGGAEPKPGSSFTGGKGHDLFYLTSYSGLLDLDLASGHLSVGTKSPYSLEANSFEDAELFAERVVLVGTNGPNRLGVGGCENAARGRNGNDTIWETEEVHFDTWVHCTKPDSTYGMNANGGAGHDKIKGTLGPDTLRGGRGRDDIRGRVGDDRLIGGRDNDHLEGQRGRDVLKGGPGWDTADGGKGRDVCHAERKRRCERH